jgi:hypothetical protein
MVVAIYVFLAGAGRSDRMCDAGGRGRAGQLGSRDFAGPIPMLVGVRCTDIDRGVLLRPTYSDN